MKTLEIQKTNFKVSDFILWLRANTLELSPSFQRRPVWQSIGKSYLIDTIVRGLPAPIIFIREKRINIKTLESTREVVDGQQRLRTIFSYVCPGLLKDFKKDVDYFTVLKTHNKELAEKDFADLSEEQKTKILDYEFSVHVLSSQVSDGEILQIFSRMNSTGVKLNRQELRNAEFIGEFKVSMCELASEQLQRWREWDVFTEYNIARMEEVELTSEFALLMIKGLTGKSQGALDKIYKDKERAFLERAEVERRFGIVMDAISDNLGSDIKSLLFRKKSSFYILFALFYDLLFGIDSLLKKTKHKPVSNKTIVALKSAGEKIEKRKAPDQVLNAVDRRTTNIDSRRNLLKYFKEQV